MTTSVTPIPGLQSTVSTGGTAVNAVGPNPNGGIITNPASAIDQGISVAENLYVNPVTTAGTVGHGTTFTLAPGQSWIIIPGQTTPTSVNAVTSGHAFSVVSW
jgi:hypothetical protein